VDAAVVDLVPDSIAVTAPPLLHHDDLSPAQRVERMLNLNGRARIASAGCS
jgi:hypothetical protein